MPVAISTSFCPGAMPLSACPTCIRMVRKGRGAGARKPPTRLAVRGSPANAPGADGSGSAMPTTVPVNTAAELPAALHVELGPTHEQAIRRVRENAVSKAHLNSRMRLLCQKGEPPQCRLIRRRLARRPRFPAPVDPKPLVGIFPDDALQKTMNSLRIGEHVSGHFDFGIKTQDVAAFPFFPQRKTWYDRGAGAMGELYEGRSGAGLQT